MTFVETDRKSVRKMFPHLIKELEGKENKVTIDSVRADAAQAEEVVNDAEEVIIADAEKAQPDKFRHYNPTVVDFIRSGEVDLIINTPLGKGAFSDGLEIRQAAGDCRLPEYFSRLVVRRKCVRSRPGIAGRWHPSKL